jgi:anti-sigma-K factor RskA
MNLVELQKKLLAAARAHPPGDAVPYAFEKRIVARLRARPAEDAGLWWGRALWRAAGACVAVSFLLGVWTYLPSNAAASSTSFSQDLEQTMLAAVDDADETW